LDDPGAGERVAVGGCRRAGVQRGRVAEGDVLVGTSGGVRCAVSERGLRGRAGGEQGDEENGRQDREVPALASSFGCVDGSSFGEAGNQQIVPMETRTMAERTLPNESVALSVTVCCTPVHSLLYSRPVRLAPVPSVGAWRFVRFVDQTSELPLRAPSSGSLALPAKVMSAYHMFSASSKSS